MEIMTWVTSLSTSQLVSVSATNRLHLPANQDQQRHSESLESPVTDPDIKTVTGPQTPDHVPEARIHKRTDAGVKAVGNGGEHLQRSSSSFFSRSCPILGNHPGNSGPPPRPPRRKNTSVKEEEEEVCLEVSRAGERGLRLRA